ncbi:hypothetical protein LEP1GSC050_1876 [Leptospira broomii serovar Hurstbridge str. 5399]|uniref:Uncharacterized protein n=1 Tax=Leptospira broomii serovar Hurstbridge str. 5399 TaxID=1049789 RepID=T0F7D2_9LEPT|nr:hypothetical protein [Leptospira broomii]EQA43821.1 hypothetical protein LEP1GSC050_1876 [Leptospira broomii serovar Hurstbridge str. 5399]
MTTQSEKTNAPSGLILQSAGSILFGFMTVFVLSLGTDQILHILDVYPPWGLPMHDPGLNALALSYRIVYTILGSYIAAAYAPNNPMKHAIILGGIGLFFSSLGAIVTITQYDLGPSWYPISLVITTLPCAWIGGLIERRIYS